LAASHALDQKGVARPPADVARADILDTWHSKSAWLIGCADGPTAYSISRDVDSQQMKCCSKLKAEQCRSYSRNEEHIPTAQLQRMPAAVVELRKQKATLPMNR
jgi:hypothetical protein